MNTISGSLRLGATLTLAAVVLGAFALLPRIVKADACTSDIAGKSQAQLRIDLEACNAEIAKWTDVLNKTKRDSASFQRDIQYLTAKINAAQSNIKAKNIAIANLSKDIAVKQAKITELDNRLTQGKKAIADILKKTNEIDSYSLAEALLSNKNLSEFFVDVDTYASAEKSLDELFDELRGTKALTEVEKKELSKRKEAEAAARAAIEAAKKEVEVTQTEKKSLLKESQNREKTYAQTLAERQARAAKIRTALFSLRDSAAIPFGEALEYAEAASQVTGVRPAFILGILTQESNLGQNVGSCIITNLTSGETKSVNSGKVFSNGIHPTRDLPPLQSILGDLGRDPMSTKVSCPLSIGYGGGMGPAQFIPSTWNIMKNKIANATGIDVPDPWNPAHAIMASALYLKDLGAGVGTYEAERNAACKYYSGRSCSLSKAGAGYGNSVMAKTTNIQTNMIDPLKF